MKPGGVLYLVNDVLVGAQTHLTWYSFATEYEDGETQFGHFIVGHDRLGIGIVANTSGVLVNSSTVEARVARLPDGWSERVDLNVDGEAWEILQPEPLRILPTGHTPNRQQEGICRRVGEKRRAVRWLAWGETAHGTHRVHRYAPLYRRKKERDPRLCSEIEWPPRRRSGGSTSRSHLNNTRVCG